MAPSSDEKHMRRLINRKRYFIRRIEERALSHPEAPRDDMTIPDYTQAWIKVMVDVTGELLVDIEREAEREVALIRTAAQKKRRPWYQFWKED